MVRVEWPQAGSPNTAVTRAARGIGLRPLVVHSTSWREDRGTLVLTYLVVVKRPRTLQASLEPLAIAPKSVALGDALTPPAVLSMHDVAVHALRHLAWLHGSDNCVRTVLNGGWARALTPFQPLPFLALADVPASPHLCRGVAHPR